MSQIRLSRCHLAAGEIEPTGICLEDPLYSNPLSAAHLRCLALQSESLSSRMASINFALSDPISLVRLEAASKLALCWAAMFKKGGIDQVISDIKHKSSKPFLYFKGADPRLNSKTSSNPEIACRNYRLSVLMAIQNIFINNNSAFSTALALAFRENNFLAALRDWPSHSKIADCLQNNQDYFPDIDITSDNPFENVFNIIKTAIVSNLLSDEKLRMKFLDQQAVPPDLSKHSARNNAIIYTTMVIIQKVKQTCEGNQSCLDAFNDYLRSMKTAL